jgi:predicted membrane chloride channel (bestrophin family)
VVDTWDRDKEAGRVFRRQLFSFLDWRRHRSSFRYVHQLETLLTSRVLRGLLWPVIMFSAIATAVVAWQSLAAAVASGALLAAAPAALAPYVPASLPSLPVVPLEVFSLVSFAMALLLGSRISTSYGRWNEARQQFGSITTTARNLFRQALALLPPEATGARALMCRWLIAYVRCAKWYVRENEPIFEELSPWLTRSELRALLQSPHPPNYTLAVLSRVLASTPGLDNYALVRLEEGLSDMMRGLSACDRILNTPAPLMFSRHATRLLTLFLVLLPLGLWPVMGVGTIFAEAIVAFALTGIEEVGISIEEPLSILPLEKLCIKAERQIEGMLRVDAAVLAYVSRELAVRGSAGGARPPLPLSDYTDEGPLGDAYGGPAMAAAMRERAAMLKAAVVGMRVKGGVVVNGGGGRGIEPAISSMDPEDVVQRRQRGGSPIPVWARSRSPSRGDGGGGGAAGGAG